MSFLTTFTARGSGGTVADGSITLAKLSASASPAGKKTMSIPAASMLPALTNGAAWTALETTTNKNNYLTLAFNASTEQYASFRVAMPKSWNEGTITAVFFWSHPSTMTNFGVVWGIKAVARGDSDAMDNAFGTGQEVTDTGGATDTTYKTSEISAVTIAGTPAEGDMVEFRVYRKAADASDTLAVDARLHGVALYFTADAGNDS